MSIIDLNEDDISQFHIDENANVEIYETEDNRNSDENVELIEDSVESMEIVQNNLQLENILFENINNKNSRCTTKETVEDSLERIRKELMTLNIDNSIDENYTRTLNLYQKISDERNQRMTRFYKDICDKVDEKEDKRENIIIPSNLQLKYQDAQRLISLESKVSILERKLGVSYDETDERVDEPPLTTQINELYRHLSLLTNNGSENMGQLSEFEAKLKDMNSSFENSLLGKRIAKDPQLLYEFDEDLVDDVEKVSRIKESYSEINKYKEFIPFITKRMQSLGNMDSDIQESLLLVEDWNDIIHGLDTQTRKWESILEKIDRRLDLQHETFINNMNEIKSILNNI